MAITRVHAAAFSLDHAPTDASHTQGSSLTLMPASDRHLHKSPPWAAPIRIRGEQFNDCLNCDAFNAQGRVNINVSSVRNLIAMG